jgi:phage-related protein
MARVNVSYAGTSLQTANIVCQEFDHEGLEHKQLDLQRLAVRDGSKLLNVTFNPRIIRIRGQLKYTTMALLEAGIDDFKELLNKTTKHLDIGYASGTRRYTCDMARITILRRHFNLTYCDFEIEFVCSKYPFGRTLDTTSMEYSISSLATAWESFVASGNYNPLPKITMTFTEVANVDGVRVRNITTGDLIEVNKSGGFINNDTIVIDCDQKTVTLNGSAWDYTGVFPTFFPKGNDLRISMKGTPAAGLYHYKMTVSVVYYPMYL